MSCALETISVELNYVPLWTSIECSKVHNSIAELFGNLSRTVDFRVNIELADAGSVDHVADAASVETGPPNDFMSTFQTIRKFALLMVD